MSELNNDVIVREVELHEVSTDLHDIESYVNFCKFFMANISNLWASANLELKQKFQSLIFPKGISFDGEHYRTPQLSIIFELTNNLPENYDLVAPSIATLNTLSDDLQTLYEFKRLTKSA